MKKMTLVLAVMSVLIVLSVCAVADPTGTDEVFFEGNAYCIGVDSCPNFATWGGTAGGYVVLYDSDGKTPSDYLWINFDGTMTFESELPGGGFAQLPPAGLPFLGGLVENGSLQEIDQFFPGGVTRPLFIESEVDTPEPSTLLLFGPAAVFLFNRARRFRRS